MHLSRSYKVWALTSAVRRGELTAWRSTFLTARPPMVDAGMVNFGCAPEFGAGPRSPGLSEHQEVSSRGSAEKGSAAVDADQQQTSATLAPSTDKEGANDHDCAVVVEAPPSRSFEAEDSIAAAEAPTPSAEDYSCAICFELLLRPITLCCGHRLCRGCWTRVLQGSTVPINHRGLYCSQTGLVAAECTCTGPHEKATCPLGRCRVLQTVPAVDVALINELYSRFGSQLTTRATEHALADEEILVNAVTAKIGQVTSWASNDLGTAEVAASWAETEYWTPRDERGGDGWALRAAQWDAGIIRGPSRLERTRATHALSMPLSIFVTGVLAIACLFIGSVCLMLRVFA